MPDRFRALLDRLEAARRQRAPGASPARLLDAARRARVSTAEELIRLHETALFLRAYPHDRATLRAAERLLAGVPARVRRLAAAGANLSALDTPETSGIAGTTITTDYSRDVVAWLTRGQGRRVQIAWSGEEPPDHLRAVWPRFLPLLWEEAAEDANVPYLQYLRAALPPGSDALAWLLERIESLPGDEVEKAERFDALGLQISWHLADSASSRTGLRGPMSGSFFHPGPLLSRREVSLEEELAEPPLPVRRLSRRAGEEIVELTRVSTALRYREYYGFTYGDPNTVLRAEAGRGLHIYLLGLVRDRRLPLRAGFAGFMVKNGVPVGYVEALAFFERIEVGFNIYYTFRDGESAWIFARVLKLLRQELGVTSFSIDPYQIGHENPEAIDSGAFWFYRKLGFRATDRGREDLARREEARMASDPAHRTAPGSLRRLAQGNVLYEVGHPARSPWDRFHVRNLALAVNRRMAREQIAPEEFRARASQRIARTLGLAPARWPAAERRAFEDLALHWSLIPDLARWPSAEKRALGQIARAKAGESEREYLRRLRGHARLRTAMLRLGSRPALPG